MNNLNWYEAGKPVISTIDILSMYSEFSDLLKVYSAKNKNKTILLMCWDLYDDTWFIKLLHSPVGYTYL
jgi:hypothetical protein